MVDVLVPSKMIIRGGRMVDVLVDLLRVLSRRLVEKLGGTTLHGQ